MGTSGPIQLSWFRYQADQSTHTTMDGTRSTNLYGFHDKRTSEMYTESIELPTTVTANDGLRLSISLVNGTTFKIMGLAICS